MEEINTKHADAILSRFLVTIGDEFQGLLTKCGTIPDLIWDLEDDLADVEVRVGIGCGVLETELQESAIGMDGPVWHAARNAILRAKDANALGGVFEGFGDEDDAILNGFARLLRHFREDLTETQREVVSLSRGGMNRSGIAQKLGITNQALGKHLKAAGWLVYQEGESAWKTALAKYDYSENWSER